MKLRTAIRLFRLFISAPGWLKGILITLVFLVLLLLPVLGLLVGVVLVVLGLVALILWPIHRAHGAIKRRFR